MEAAGGEASPDQSVADLASTGPAWNVPQALRQLGEGV